MKCLGKIAVCLAGGLMLHISARADDTVAPNNPYEPIVVRNVFGLNPPQAITNQSTPDEPPLKITPNGIMSIFGQLQVLFKVAPKPGQPGAKEQSYVLSEGQSQDEIEVVRINEKAGVVTFNNHGTEQEIPLANAPALNMPMPGGPGGAIPGQNIPAAPGGTIPNRVGGSRFGGRSGGQSSSPAMSTLPTRQAQQNTMSTDEHQLMMVAQKLKAQQDGAPTAIFPPTPFDAEAGINNNGGPPAPPGSRK